MNRTGGDLISQTSINSLLLLHRAHPIKLHRYNGNLEVAPLSCSHYGTTFKLTLDQLFYLIGMHYISPTNCAKKGLNLAAYDNEKGPCWRTKQSPNLGLTQIIRLLACQLTYPFLLAEQYL